MTFDLNLGRRGCALQVCGGQGRGAGHTAHGGPEDRPREVDGFACEARHVGPLSRDEGGGEREDGIMRTHGNIGGWGEMGLSGEWGFI